ncbi:MAG: hypothetical protein SVQ76_02390 [Candidatus Nanohaloarchaea archaeon]|nr:hypothetical protein [Candidatus Nanohaloarchaea archaeon]
MVDLSNLFGRKVLEGYLAVVIVLLTVITYLVLAGMGGTQNSNIIMAAILLIVLIGVNVLNAIIQLRILEAVKG